MAPHHCLHLQFQGMWHTILASTDTKLSCGVHSSLRQNNYTYKNVLKFNTSLKFLKKSKAMIRGVRLAGGKRDEAQCNNYRSSVDHVGKATVKPASKGHQQKRFSECLRVSSGRSLIRWGAVPYVEDQGFKKPYSTHEMITFEGSAGTSPNNPGKTSGKIGIEIVVAWMLYRALVRLMSLNICFPSWWRCLGEV